MNQSPITPARLATAFWISLVMFCVALGSYVLGYTTKPDTVSGATSDEALVLALKRLPYSGISDEDAVTSAMIFYTATHIQMNDVGQAMKSMREVYGVSGLQLAELIAETYDWLEGEIGNRAPTYVDFATYLNPYTSPYADERAATAREWCQRVAGSLLINNAIVDVQLRNSDSTGVSRLREGMYDWEVQSTLGVAPVEMGQRGNDVYRRYSLDDGRNVDVLFRGRQLHTFAISEAN